MDFNDKVLSLSQSRKLYIVISERLTNQRFGLFADAVSLKESAHYTVTVGDRTV